MYQVYCRLVGSPLAEVVAMGEGFSLYLERSKNLLRYRADMTDAEANHVWTLLIRVSALMEDRNHVIHGLWMPTAPGGPDQFTTLSWRGEASRHRRSSSPLDIS